MKPTNKEIARIAGRSITWLRTHLCAWCGQTMLRKFRGECSAIHEKCDTRFVIEEAELAEQMKDVEAFSTVHKRLLKLRGAEK